MFSASIIFSGMDLSTSGLLPAEDDDEEEKEEEEEEDMARKKSSSPRHLRFGMPGYLRPCRLRLARHKNASFA